MILIMLFFSDEVIPYNIILVDSYKIFHNETDNSEEGLLQYTIRGEVFYTKEWDYYNIVDLSNDLDQQSKVIEILQKLKENHA